MPDSLYPGSQYTDPLLFANSAQQITSAIPQGIQLGTQIRQQLLNEELAKERLAAQQRAEERLLADRRVASLGGQAEAGGGRRSSGSAGATGGVAQEYMPALDEVQQMIAQQQQQQEAQQAAIAQRERAFSTPYLSRRQEEIDLEAPVIPQGVVPGAGMTGEDAAYLREMAQMAGVSSGQAGALRLAGFTPARSSEGYAEAMTPEDAEYLQQMADLEGMGSGQTGALARSGFAPDIGQTMSESDAANLRAQAGLSDLSVGQFGVLQRLGLMPRGENAPAQREDGSLNPVALQAPVEAPEIRDPLAGLLLSPEQAQAQIEEGLLETESSPEERQRFWQQLTGVQRQVGQERQAEAQEEAQRRAQAAEQKRQQEFYTVLATDPTLSKRLDGRALQALSSMDPDTADSLLKEMGSDVRNRRTSGAAYARVAEDRKGREFKEEDILRQKEAVFKEEFGAELAALRDEHPFEFAAMERDDVGPPNPAVFELQDKIEAARTRATRKAEQRVKPTAASPEDAPIPEADLIAAANELDIPQELHGAFVRESQRDPGFGQKVLLRTIQKEDILSRLLGSGISGGASPVQPRPVEPGSTSKNAVKVKTEAEAFKHPGKWVNLDGQKFLVEE